MYEVLQNENKYKKCTYILRMAMLLNGHFLFDTMCSDKKERGAPMTEIIYLDIDGTLRDEKIGLLKSTEKAIRECRKKGIRIILCTGRNEGSIQEDVRRLETDGIVTGGGCCIVLKGVLLKNESFSSKILKEFLAAIKKQNLGASLESGQEIYMNQGAAEFYKQDFEKKIRGYPQAEQIKRENKISYEDNLRDIWKGDKKIHKVCLMGTAEKIESMENSFQQYAETIQKKEWNGIWYLEMLPKGCGKGSAVRLINERLAIDKKNSMSFGDGDNDIDMFKETGVRVAVSGGSLKLMAYADSICQEPAKDGIAEELKKRGIIAGRKGQNMKSQFKEV